MSRSSQQLVLSLRPSGPLGASQFQDESCPSAAGLFCLIPDSKLGAGLQMEILHSAHVRVVVAGRPLPAFAVAAVCTPHWAVPQGICLAALQLLSALRGLQQPSWFPWTWTGLLPSHPGEGQCSPSDAGPTPSMHCGKRRIPFKACSNRHTFTVIPPTLTLLTGASWALCQQVGCLQLQVGEAGKQSPVGHNSHSQKPCRSRRHRLFPSGGLKPCSFRPHYKPFHFRVSKSTGARTGDSRGAPGLASQKLCTLTRPSPHPICVQKPLGL